jgi:hypothetical protein
MLNEPKARNIWAPELFYDSKEKLWYIFWSTTVTGKFPDETGVSEDQYNHRAYYVTTRDFETFSESKLYFDPGFNIIDATMARMESVISWFSRMNGLPRQRRICAWPRPRVRLDLSRT